MTYQQCHDLALKHGMTHRLTAYRLKDDASTTAEPLAEVYSKLDDKGFAIIKYGGDWHLFRALEPREILDMTETPEGKRRPSY